MSDNIRPTYLTVLVIPVELVSSDDGVAFSQKPESWRLSCQTIVGDKSNSGKVSNMSMSLHARSCPGFASFGILSDHHLAI